MRPWLGLLLVALVLLVLTVREASRDAPPTEPGPDRREAEIAADGDVPSPDVRPIEPDDEEDPEDESGAYDPDGWVRWSEEAVRSAKTLTGRIRDAMTGAPIADARITGLEGHGPMWYSARNVTLGRVRHGSTSNAEGRFEIDVVYGQTVLVVEADGYAPARTLLRRETGEHVFRLVAAGKLTGRVTDPEGRPVPGARVVAALRLGWRTCSAPAVRDSPRAYGPGEMPADEPILVGEETTADEQGRYSLPGLAGGQAYEVYATTEGFAGSPVHHDLRLEPGAVRVLDLPLFRGATLVLRVFDENGKPTAGAKLELEPGEERRRPRYGTAGAHGTIRLRSVLPGPYRAKVVIPWGEDSSFDVVLEDGATVTRDVTHGVRDLPEEEDAPWPSGPLGRPGRKDLEARIRVALAFPPEVPPPTEVAVALEEDGGSYHQTVEIREGRLVLDLAARYRRLVLRSPGVLETRIPLDLKPGDDVTLPVVRFSRGASLEVLVRGPDGRPVAGATVSTNGPSHRFWRTGQDGTTDTSGRVVLHGLQPAEPADIWITAAGLVTHNQEHRPGRIEVRLGALAVLRGQFLDEAGRPFGHLVAIAHRFREDGETGCEDWGTSDGSGWFRLAVPPGRYRIEVRRPGALNSEDATYHELELGPGDNPFRRLLIPR